MIQISKRLIGTLLSGIAITGATTSEGKDRHAAKPKDQRPNVIYILADDMGWGDISAHNPQSKIQTPALDSIVRNGVTFSNAHSNSAVSTPTRYGILTGRYCFRSKLKSGVLVGYDEPLIEPNRATVASFLRDNGYHTACIGKWHLGLSYTKYDSSKPLIVGDQWSDNNSSNVNYQGTIAGPALCGFEYSYIIPSSLDIAPYLYIRNGKVTANEVTKRPAWKDTRARGMWYRQGDVASDFKHSETLENLVGDAKSYIRSKAHSDSSFFLYLPLTSPHTPWLPSDKFLGKSGAGVYGDFVMMTDAMVKEVMDECKKHGIDRNTIVIFASDNGSHWLPADVKAFGHEANYSTSGMKSDAWDGGHRVPLLVYWPNGGKHGETVSKMVCTTDLFATVANLLGQKLQDNEAEDSYTMLPYFATKKVKSTMKPRTNIIHHSIEGKFAIREGKWKYIDCKGSGGWSYSGKAEDPAAQLYDMERDPQEKDNLIAKHPDIASRLKDLLEKQKSAGRSR